MKILVASSSFKGSFSPREASEAIARGAREASPGAEVRVLPLCDGGEGTLELILAARDGRPASSYVTGPRGAEIKAVWGLLDGGREAVIQASAANGLSLVPEHSRDPEKTTAIGVGQIVLDALERGCERITLTLGDSATVDGGVGMAMALGFSVRDAKDLEIGYTGGVLREVTHVVTDGVHGRLEEVDFRALYDVDNPLLGPRGAAAVYGPQKGASPEQVDALEDGLAQLAEVLERDLGVGPDLKDRPGAGAAGGLGWGCAAWLGAELVSGAATLMELQGFEEALDEADLVLVGEGSWDATSSSGKASGKAVAAARESKKRVAVVCAAGEGDGVWNASAIEAAGRRLTLDDLARIGGAAVEGS